MYFLFPYSSIPNRIQRPKSKTSVHSILLLRHGGDPRLDEKHLVIRNSTHRPELEAVRSRQCHRWPSGVWQTMGLPREVRHDHQGDVRIARWLVLGWHFQMDDILDEVIKEHEVKRPPRATVSVLMRWTWSTCCWGSKMIPNWKFPSRRTT